MLFAKAILCYSICVHHSIPSDFNRVRSTAQNETMSAKEPNANAAKDQWTTGDHPAMKVVLGSQQIAVKRRAKYRELAELNRQRRKLVEAERCLEKALYISMNILSSDNLQVATDLELLATIAYELGKKEAAEALMMRSRRIKQGFES